MTKINRVLFICYANICRSPAAHKLAEYYAKKHELRGVIFDSAGWHEASDTATQETKNYVEAKGIDMSDFKSKVITREMVENNDLIIGMERYHILKVKQLFKDLKNKLEDKTYTLKEFNGADKNNLNIPDPYNTGLENYNNILKIVEENVEMLVKKIVEINSSS